MRYSLKNFAIALAVLSLAGCKGITPSQGTDSPDASGLSLPMYDNKYGCDPTCVVTEFRQAVAGPQDCYCLSCPTAMPGWAATLNENQYARFCSNGGPAITWQGHDCIMPYCTPADWLCTCPDGPAAGAPQ